MRKLQTLLKLTRRSQLPSHKPLFSSSTFLSPKPQNLLNPSLKPSTLPLHFPYLSFHHKISAFSSQFLHFSTTSDVTGEDPYESDQDLVIEEWEEEDDTDPEIGDGGAGGGIVLQDVPWGEKALSIAREVLLQFDDDIKLYSFKTTPRGYIYVRLDKLSNEYGCPSMELIESYSREYKKRLEEDGSKGEIPNDLALQVSSPGADRLLSVPEDLIRFKDFPMVVSYVEGITEAKSQEKSGVFLLDSIETESEHCVWKLADVKANRDPESKGRPMSRKRKDLRLKLPYSVLNRVTLYLDSMSISS